MARVKVTINDDLKLTLEGIADRYGCSLSKLLLDAAVEIHLVRRHPEQLALDRLSDRLLALERELSLHRASKPVEAPPAKVVRGRYETRKPKKGGETFALSDKPVLEASYREMQLHSLVERFGGDRALIARLCQLGGRSGSLFQGSLVDAQRVEAVTSRLDPDGLPWFPLAPDRAKWVQTTALLYCRDILKLKPE